MQFISTKYHAILDYLMGGMLVSTPWLFYQWDNSLGMQVLVISGMALVFYSLITRYEKSLFKVISVKLHLTIDVFMGIALMISPWILGFHKDIFLPHVCFGALQLVMVAFSSPNRVHQLYTGPHHHKF